LNRQAATLNRGEVIAARDEHDVDALLEKPGATTPPTEPAP
jgi:hypothetical protein